MSQSRTSQSVSTKASFKRKTENKMKPTVNKSSNDTKAKTDSQKENTGLFESLKLNKLKFNN